MVWKKGLVEVVKSDVFQQVDVYGATAGWLSLGKDLQDHFRSFASEHAAACLVSIQGHKSSTKRAQYSYGRLLVITGYKWDYTFYKWGYKYL